MQKGSTSSNRRVKDLFESYSMRFRPKTSSQSNWVGVRQPLPTIKSIEMHRTTSPYDALVMPHVGLAAASGRDWARHLGAGVRFGGGPRGHTRQGHFHCMSPTRHVIYNYR